VLGLCALGLGAARVVAVDLKPGAVEATRSNATLNGMDRRLEATDAPLGEIDGTFDAVLANIGRAASSPWLPTSSSACRREVGWR
jgi:ribosomal protein L11 methylase PrmA